MPKLYGYLACPRSRMALVAASEKGIECSFQAVASWDGLDKLPIFTRLHPFQKVPVLEHGGLRVTETLAILMYIETAFEGPPLVPDEPLALARMWEIISATTSYAWSPWVQTLAMNRIIRPIVGDGADEAAIAAYLPETCRAAEVIGDYLAAREETFDLADIVVAGAIKYATETPEWERIARFAPALETWWNRTRSRPSIAAHMPDTDLKKQSNEYFERHRVL